MKFISTLIGKFLENNPIEVVSLNIKKGVIKNEIIDIIGQIV